MANNTAAQSNTSAELTSAVLARFSQQVGAGTIIFRAWLRSNGTQPCALAGVDILGG